MANAPKSKKAPGKQSANSESPKRQSKVEQRDAEALVKKLVAKLAEHDPASPITLGQLAEEAEVPVAGRSGKNSVLALQRKKVFQSQAVVPFKDDLDSPVALRSAEAMLLHSGVMLAYAIKKSAKKAAEARGAGPSGLFSVAVLRDTVIKRLHDHFVQVLEGDIDDAALPKDCGWIYVHIREETPMQRRFFLRKDIHFSPSSPGQEAAAVAGPTTSRSADVQAAGPHGTFDFTQAFDVAFARIDLEGGSYNFVSLVDLRKALPVSREAFDAGLRQLRLARRYTLSAAEGRDGLSPEEQQAGIREARSLLLHVSRIER